MGRRGVVLTLAGVLGVGAVAGLVYVKTSRGPAIVPDQVQAQAGAGTAEGSPAERALKASLPELSENLKKSDTIALAALWQRLEQKEGAPKTALSDLEGKEWVEVIKSLRFGYPKYEGSTGRATAVLAAGRILQKYTVDPAPASWIAAFPPVRDILLTGVIDTDADVRATALGEIAKLWSWAPSRTPLPVEEQSLADWKDSMTAPVVRRLGDADSKVRVGAVACLGLNPIPAVAERAVPFIEDRNGDVRQQVLASFGRRVNLLTEDAILKRLHDEEPGIPQLAEIVLKARGLNRDQIFLGRLITSPKPEMRASVIPMLLERTDIDPVVWIVQLSHDADEKVRTQAVLALAKQDTPEARKRLKEVATSDTSTDVRATAGKIVAGMTTASLPPLPGSPRLNPRAN